MKVLVFGGTTEGGLLAKTLSETGHSVTLAVATLYAKELSSKECPYAVTARRMDEYEMTRYLTDHPQDVVVDATHPYAEKATRNILYACRNTNTEYLRLVRSKSRRNPEIRYVKSMEESVRILSKTSGNVFLAIGSKDLEHFTRLDGFASRCHVRILPMVESLQKTIQLGFRNSNVICMQGPFDEETNRAMFFATKSKYLVTKDSGETGGVDAKISAALHCGCQAVVVERPVVESGFSFDELYEYFGVAGQGERNAGDTNFFPLFHDMKDKRVLVVGGGKVAERRIGVLVRFGAKIHLVSPGVTDGLREMIDKEEIAFTGRKYVPGDVERFRPFLTIASTDHRETNDAVAGESKSNGIPVVVSDRREQCDCFFPAIAENDTLLAGIVSKDGNHKNVRIMAERIRHLFNEINS